MGTASTLAFDAVSGVFINATPEYLKSTGFVLDRTVGSRRRVLQRLIGRLVPEDLVGLIRYTQSH